VLDAGAAWLADTCGFGRDWRTCYTARLRGTGRKMLSKPFAVQTNPLVAGIPSYCPVILCACERERKSELAWILLTEVVGVHSWSQWNAAVGASSGWRGVSSASSMSGVGECSNAGILSCSKTSTATDRVIQIRGGATECASSSGGRSGLSEWDLRRCSANVSVTGGTFDSVLCFGDSDWWYHNRGHADMQYMRRFARRCPVLYVNSLGMRRPRSSEGRVFVRRIARKALSIARYCADGGEGFWVLSPVFFPVFTGWLGAAATKILGLQITTLLRVLRMRRPLVWVVCPSAACVLDQVARAGLVYQFSDAYTELSGGPHCLAGTMEARIARQADLILCASKRLVERARRLYGHGQYMEHGVDFELFDSAVRKPCLPGPLRKSRRPMVGFFGNMDGNTVDRSLLEQVIRTRPQYQFVFVGPMADEFRSLRRHPNVIAIPRQPYRTVAHYGAAFDVCLMPWLHNHWIEHCNPIKLKEYLALGKPVVSTPFPELQRCGDLCYRASGADDFAWSIDRALQEDDERRQAARQAWAARHTWDGRFAKVLHLCAERGITLDGSISCRC